MKFMRCASSVRHDSAQCGRGRPALLRERRHVYKFIRMGAHTGNLVTRECQHVCTGDQEVGDAVVNVTEKVWELVVERARPAKYSFAQSGKDGSKTG